MPRRGRVDGRGCGRLSMMSGSVRVREVLLASRRPRRYPSQVWGHPRCRPRAAWVGVIAVSSLLAACASSASTVATEPTASPEPAATATLEPSPTPRPASEVAPTPEPTPEPDPTLTREPTPTASPPVDRWYLDIVALDDEMRALVEPTSWRPGCPVGLDALRLLRFPHVGFDGQVHAGELVIAADWAEAVGSVFEQLFDAGYAIERIELVDVFDGDDQRSMVANNTSAFNCREVAYRPGVWSNHAYGTAIDLNPLYNPYVSGDFVDPAVAAPYVDRDDVRLGMIADDDAAVVAFASIGWIWGGDWAGGVKDYQHFSANGR